MTRENDVMSVRLRKLRLATPAAAVPPILLCTLLWSACGADDGSLSIGTEETSAESLLEQAVHLRQQAYHDSALVHLSDAMKAFYSRRDTAGIIEGLLEAAYCLASLRRLQDSRDSLARITHHSAGGSAARHSHQILLVESFLSLNAGHYETAARTAARAASTSSSEKDSAGVLMARCYQAWAERELGDYHAATRTIQRALASNNASSQSKDVMVATAYCLNQLGQAYWYQGDEVRSEAVLRETLSIRKRLFGTASVLTTAAGSNLANVLLSTGRFEAALRLFFDDLDAQQALYGSFSEGVARSHSNIGLVYWYLGRPRQAAEFLERSREVRLGLQGEAHPALHINYNRLGLVYQELGEIQKALWYHSLSLKAKISRGVDHPEIAHVYNNIGVLWNSAGRHDSALVYLHLARDLRERTIGKHTDLAIIYHNLGHTQDALGNQALALRLHLTGLSINEDVAGGERLKVA